MIHPSVFHDPSIDLSTYVLKYRSISLPFRFYLLSTFLPLYLPFHLLTHLSTDLSTRLCLCFWQSQSL